jgi:hypothetical protein
VRSTGRELLDRRVVAIDRRIELAPREVERAIAAGELGIDRRQLVAGDRLHRQAGPGVGEDLLGDAQARHRARKRRTRLGMGACGVGLQARGMQRVERGRAPASAVASSSTCRSISAWRDRQSASTAAKRSNRTLRRLTIRL